MNNLKVHIAVIMAMAQNFGEHWKPNQINCENNFGYWGSHATNKSKNKRRENKRRENKRGKRK